ncbi:MAG: hypothetical protein A2315_06805 [Ignavibacteria bacterium RIFOXYB2_FULL_35_12]|nr:MAG: hypothetical protein A2058_08280 [Ignavibacteria bacterium GWA2_36_19]OGU51813.1 MAG: hypothetical protein A2006_07420 [Ignavibacteria bacterium GWC2_35_8]OGU62745.1 MAG: hypothetical protein A2X60_05070 [Ignavibacteria bacterium GWF2_35_20]OGU81558.1 MAG: hypothetical protein A2254_01230 [Ignavibacteria bacterium RIFOXYA2_FULL_35_9]OGU85716.1 MAG: hypothetical protein A3K31_05455 [Ignavibacteria bacterium RIFOXYA12_FULL_35_25]OGU89516.1 MAG: hypothetical protein A2492_11005 [Ignavibac
MGTNVILDIMGSIIIGGILMITLFRISDRATESTYNKTGDLTIQQNIASVVRTLEYDFRKIGYCADWTQIPNPSKSIIFAKSDGIKFLTDVDRDGKVDTMYYYTGPVSELIYTANPRDRILYRVVNNEKPVKVNLGVTQFDLVYYNVDKEIIPTPVSVLGEIYTIQISVAVEDIEAYDQKYSQVFWRQIRLVAKNLRNR